MGQVIVVGSVNTDYSVRIGQLPRPGETVTGGQLEIQPGGKGANQAHAAARLGAAVTLVAAVGADASGDSAVADLAAAGISTGCVIRSDAPSGVAMILVDAAGENMIAVAPGANERLTAETVRELLAGRLAAAPGSAAPGSPTPGSPTPGSAGPGGAGPGPAARTGGTVLLASLEVPLTAVVAAAVAATAAGATVVINPAPGQVLPPELLRGAIVTPNEGEILRVAPPADSGARPGEAAAVNYLLAAGAVAVIVTRGSRGATVFRPDQAALDVPAPQVKVVDTVGAGDAFNGALATALTAGLPLETAVAAAVQAGAAACTGAGARQALPWAGDIALLS